jgi:hypothetical protein
MGRELWAGLMWFQGKETWRVVVNAMMNLDVPLNARNFLLSRRKRCTRGVTDGTVLKAYIFYDLIVVSISSTVLAL